jgi:hypothetical protein
VAVETRNPHRAFGLQEPRMSLQRCVIHYGMPKTGSSSIQTWLLRSLSDPRFMYLNVGTRGSGNLIANLFKDAPEQLHRNLKLGVDSDTLQRQLQQTRAALLQQITSSSAETLVFSAEMLSNFSTSELQRLCEFIQPHVREMRAVGYVRKPVSFMESVFQQRVKSGTDTLDPARNYPRYRERLQKFEQRFGSDGVDYWLFDAASLRNGCVVQDFCARLEVTTDGSAVPRVNDSLSLEALRLLFAYRRYGPGFGKGPGALEENRMLRIRLRELAGPRMRFHASLVEPVLQRFVDDIAWMEARLGTSLLEEPCTAADAIRDEQDLLRFSPRSVQWLARQIGGDIDEDAASQTSAQDVAEWMHRLRQQLAHPRNTPGAVFAGGLSRARQWFKRMRG